MLAKLPHVVDEKTQGGQVLNKGRGECDVILSKQSNTPATCAQPIHPATAPSHDIRPTHLWTEADQGIGCAVGGTDGSTALGISGVIAKQLLDRPINGLVPRRRRERAAAERHHRSWRFNREFFLERPTNVCHTPGR